MRYTASSIKKALQKNKKIFIAGLEDLECPRKSKQVWVLDNIKKCYGDPKICPDATNKSCKQPINIYRNENGPLLAVLNFYFTISKTNHDGFIDEGDASLGRLIHKGFIDVNTLQSVA